MNSYFSGEIILVKFAFTQATDAKRRPGLVLLDTDDEDVIVATQFTLERIILSE